MFVLINGAFGVGKSTVAREVRKLLPGAAIFDPEWLGIVLQRLPGFHSSDFQHLRTWRRLTIAGARALGGLRSPVLIPMAFSEPTYLEEVKRGLAKSGRPVLHFCLVAPLHIIRERLATRGESLHDPDHAWVHRRAAECCAVHSTSTFSVQIQTEQSSAGEVAKELVERIRPNTTVQQAIPVDRA